MKSLISPLTLIKISSQTLYTYRRSFFHVAAPSFLISLAIVTLYHLFVLSALPDLAAIELSPLDQADKKYDKDPAEITEKYFLIMLAPPILVIALAAPFMCAWSRFIIYKTENTETVRGDHLVWRLKFDFLGKCELLYCLKMLGLIAFSLWLGFLIGAIIGFIISSSLEDSSLGQILGSLVLILIFGITFVRFSLILPNTALAGSNGWEDWKNSWRKTTGQTAPLLTTYVIATLIVMSMAILLHTLSDLMPKMPHDTVQIMFEVSIGLVFDYIALGLVAGISSLSFSLLSLKAHPDRPVD